MNGAIILQKLSTWKQVRNPLQFFIINEYGGGKISATKPLELWNDMEEFTCSLKVMRKIAMNKQYQNWSDKIYKEVCT